MLIASGVRRLRANAERVANPRHTVKVCIYQTVRAKPLQGDLSVDRRSDNRPIACRVCGATEIVAAYRATDAVYLACAKCHTVQAVHFKPSPSVDIRHQVPDSKRDEKAN